MDNETLMQAVIADTAAKVIGALDEGTRKAIIIAAVEEILRGMKFNREVQRVLEREAAEVAKEYLKNPGVQVQIKKKVVEGVEAAMDGLAKAVAGSAELELKRTYREWTGGRSWTYQNPEKGVIYVS